MTILFTPEQLAAAKAVAKADADMLSYLHDEPVNETSWEEWNDLYQAAYEVYEATAGAFRRLLGDIDPHDVIQGAAINPLGPSLVPDSGTVETKDRRFIAGPFFHSRDIGPWAVDLYDPPLTEGREARCLVTVMAADRTHAQQIVDLVTWAYGAGARTSDATKTVPSESGDQYVLHEVPA